MSESLHSNHEKKRNYQILEVSTMPSTRVEYHSLWKALNCPLYKLLWYIYILLKDYVHVFCENNVFDMCICVFTSMKQIAVFTLKDKILSIWIDLK